MHFKDSNKKEVFFLYETQNRNNLVGFEGSYWKKKERKGKQANRGGKMGNKNDYGV